MNVIHFPNDPVPANWTNPAVALGNFDGVHRGHTKILKNVCARASERGGTPLVLTFEPHPTRIVRPDKAPPLLMTASQKLACFETAGIEGVAIVEFTADLSQWTPDEFVRRVLVDWLRASEVWVGANFLFGHERSGNYSLLRSLGARYGFLTDKIEPVRYKDFIVSSTRVRRLISDGRVDEAGALLGHHYMLDGVIETGSGRGRGHGIPTANLQTKNELLPPDGVYATTVTIDSRILGSVTNIGHRPTFGNDGPRVVETHIFNFDADLYGKDIRLAFVQRLREERTFDDADALRQQIDTDCANAKKLFTEISL